MIGMVASAYMYKPMTDDEVDKKAATRALTFHVAWYVCITPNIRTHHTKL